MSAVQTSCNVIECRFPSNVINSAVKQDYKENSSANAYYSKNKYQQCMDASENSYTRKSSNTSNKSYSQHSNDNNLNGLSMNGNYNSFSQKSQETQNKSHLQNSRDDLIKTYTDKSDDTYNSSF